LYLFVDFLVGWIKLFIISFIFRLVNKKSSAKKDFTGALLSDSSNWLLDD
jgi:hypothetical protein